MFPCPRCGRKMGTKGSRAVHKSVKHRGEGRASKTTAPVSPVPEVSEISTALPVARAVTAPAAPSLPHIAFPADAETLLALAGGCDYLARGSQAVYDAGLEAQHFFATLSANLRARAQRAEKVTAA